MSMKILAVDDSKMMLRIISGAIAMIDHEPVTACNGREALDTLDQQGDEIALILLDWNMPVLDGIETLREIRRHERFSAVPVMMVTTEGDNENIVTAIKAGANHYLTKPFTQQDLAARMLESLGRGLELA